MKNNNAYFHHVCMNDSSHNAWSVVSIGELIERQISVKYSNLKSVAVRCDNAGTYRNSVVPMIAPFIFAAYSIRLKALILLERQDGKGPADLHLSTSSIQLDAYIKTLGMDVVTPSNLVDGSNHGFGMVSTHIKPSTPVIKPHNYIPVSYTHLTLPTKA